MSSDRFSGCLQQAVTDKLFPGCSFLYLDTTEEISLALGTDVYDPQVAVAVAPETLYDVASLTKILATMTLAQVLVDEGVLSLDDTVSKYLPEFALSEDKQAVTLLHLMTYTVDYNIPGGAKALLPHLSANQIAHNVLLNPLKNAPGRSYLYTNISAFVVAQVIEKATGKNFDDLVKEKILVPLEMTTTTFSPRDDQIPHIPPTEVTPERGEVRGVVHDEFTYYTRRGGVANGAAGLFASVIDIKNFLQMTIHGGVFAGKRFISEGLVVRWTEDVFPELLPTHTPLAWGDPNNALIDSYHRQLVVKGGFTGCFMVADLRQKRAFVLLSNRTYPTRPTDSSGFAKLKDDLMKIALR